MHIIVIYHDVVLHSFGNSRLMFNVKIDLMNDRLLCFSLVGDKHDDSEILPETPDNEENIF